VADRVDATVDAVKAPRPHPTTDGACGNPERQELGKGDHPVLPFRHVGHEQVDRARGAFRTHTVRKAPDARALPPTQPIRGPAMRDA